MTNNDEGERLKNLRLEYEQIHKTRLAWSGAITKWSLLLIPLSVTVFSIFVIINYNLWIVGFGVSCIFLRFWRNRSRNIDRQIVYLYPRLLELEKELGMEFYTRYYIRHIKTNYHEEVMKWAKVKWEIPPESYELPNRDYIIKYAKVNREEQYRRIHGRGHDEMDDNVKKLMTIVFSFAMCYYLILFSIMILGISFPFIP